MNVNFDVQLLCVSKNQLRGIHNYTINLIEELIKDEEISVILSFFDYNGERYNRNYLLNNINSDIISKVIISETQENSYRTLMNSIINPDLKFNEYNQIWKINSDIIHFPTAQFVPKNIGNKAVVTVHDIIPVIPYVKNIIKDPNSCYLNASIHNIKNNYDIKLIVDSENTKKDLIQFYGIKEERLYTIQLAYNKKVIYPEKNFNSIYKFGIYESYILYIGPMMVYKGVLEILDAYIIIKSKYKNIKMVFSGNYNAMDEKVREKLKNFPYIDDLIFTGYVSESEKRHLLSCAKLFLFPSWYEGFGIPVLEAMACGCPVVCTNNSSLPEVGGKAAIYIERDNVKQLAEVIITMLENENLCKKHIDAGFQQISQFSWKKTADETKRIYQLALEE